MSHYHEFRKHDPVNSPKHYTGHPSGIECIQVTEHMGFNLGNAIKYIWRCDDKKDAIEDLEKAAWYVNREIKKRKAKIEPEWPQDETRIDVIGSNGNTGDHYQESDQVVYATKHEIR